MTDNPFSALSALVAPAILTNACAILQNGATLRYNLAITQWREFRASLAARDDKLQGLFTDPDEAVALAERRVRLQLSGLGMLNVAVALFAATTIGGLAGAFLVQGQWVAPAPVIVAMVLSGGVALALMVAATVLFLQESACGRALMRLHWPAREP